MFIILFTFRNTCTQFCGPHWQYAVTLDKQDNKKHVHTHFPFQLQQFVLVPREKIM